MPVSLRLGATGFELPALTLVTQLRRYAVLRCGIGWRDELRHNVAGSAPCGIVAGRQILLYCAAGPRRIAILAPILTCDRTLLVGICLDQARINRKTFATNQTGRNARLDDTFENATKDRSEETPPKQVRLLHLARLGDGHGWRNGKQVLELAGSAQFKMNDVLKGRKDGKALIQSDGKGMFRLALEAPPETSEGA
ncbi:hypothetical protein JQ611_26455 [Bradyrhizobium sp. AUGA SZCCT0182]|nr:hypothetical protein [Bradyrhizobium sp. AUGA SZCCT0182]